MVLSAQHPVTDSRRSGRKFGPEKTWSSLLRTLVPALTRNLRIRLTQQYGTFQSFMECSKCSQSGKFSFLRRRYAEYFWTRCKTVRLAAGGKSARLYRIKRHQPGSGPQLLQRRVSLIELGIIVAERQSELARPILECQCCCRIGRQTRQAGRVCQGPFGWQSAAKCGVSGARWTPTPVSAQRT